MKKLHLIVGVLTLIIFILTGQYLSRVYPHMADMDSGLRMLLRSRHLYIMLGGAVNVALGLYLSGYASRWRTVVQRLGSVLLLVAPVLFILGFFTQAPRGDLNAPLAPFGLYAVFGGIVLHLISGARAGRETTEPAARGKARGAAE